jgi:cation diffusion facilitator CzcD-associated flavoprotein CzcO
VYFQSRLDANAMSSQIDFDVIIIGAGISGLCFAHRLQERNSDLTYCILEQRSRIGGTWDLFRYPGIRSDSDLHTFGFPWKPWTEKESIAQGGAILRYMQRTAADEGIDGKIKFNCGVSEMAWNSSSRSWTLEYLVNSETIETLQCRFILLATGYYDYEQPLEAMIPGIDNFGGRVVHPQFWPEDLNYTDKKIVIIGSGATAITLLPSLAKSAKHTVMLQRSPSYVMALPSEDGFDSFARRWMPWWIAAYFIRLKWIFLPTLFRAYCLTFPTHARRMVMRMTQAQLPDEKLDPNFTPAYNPFEQRMCVCPNGDFYECLRNGSGSIKTGHIKEVRATGIHLESGEFVEADVIITATGLKLRLGGGIDIFVDGKPFSMSEHYAWRGLMLESLPNLAFSFGYFDASWTLGVDTSAKLACRLLKRMRINNVSMIVPQRTEEDERRMKDLSFMPLSSTYVQKGLHALPKVGDRSWWRPRSTYLVEAFSIKLGNIQAGLNWIP